VIKNSDFDRFLEPIFFRFEKRPKSLFLVTFYAFWRPANWRSGPSLRFVYLCSFFAEICIKMNTAKKFPKMSILTDFQTSKSEVLKSNQNSYFWSLFKQV